MLLESSLASATIRGMKSGLTSLIASQVKTVVGKKLSQVTDTFMAEKINNSPSFSEPLSFAFNAAAVADSEIAGLDLYFRSKQFIAIQRSVCLMNFAESKHGTSPVVKNLQIQLAHLLPGRPPLVIENLARQLSDHIWGFCSESWIHALQAGIFTKSLDDPSTVQLLVADSLSNLVRMAEEGNALSEPEMAEIDTFAEAYRRAVANHFEYLRPQSLQEVTVVPINDLYVEPEIVPLFDQSDSRWLRDDILFSQPRFVLLGNPGGGKSTFAGKLCYDICTNSIESVDGVAPSIAMHITLMDYAKAQKEKGQSIVDYLVTHSRSVFGLTPPKNAFGALLRTGDSMVVFDGLDELLDIKDRDLIRSTVEHFIEAYPIAPVLVTSREVGYEQASLNRKKFSHFRLGAFEPAKVKEYATKWFSFTREATSEQKTQLVDSFMEESDIIPDVRSNPLMLGLLCNLYKQDGFLPKNRPDVYQRCADLLFVKWDKHRGIRYELPMDHRLRPAMGHLARWIYSDKELQTGVSESRLIVATSKYLNQWLEDSDEADAYAKQFVDFFRGRAWVFTDVGSNKNEPLYQFTHRTFLEFFTADDLVKNFSDPAALHANLRVHLKTRNWDVVCQLAYQIMVQRSLHHDTLVNLLCDDVSIGTLEERINTSSFLLRTIDLLHPSPATRRRAITSCTLLILKNVEEIESEGDLTKVATETLSALVTGSEETLKINASQTKEVVLEILADETIAAEKREGILILMTSYDVFTHMFEPIQWSERHSHIWENVASEIFASASTFAKERMKVSAQMANLMWWKGEASVPNIVASLGPGALFVVVECPILHWFYPPIAETATEFGIVPDYVRQLNLAEPYKSKQERRMEECGHIAELMEKATKPFNFPIASRSIYGHPANQVIRRQPPHDSVWSEVSDLRESALCCLAVNSELAFDKTLDEILPGGIPYEIYAFCMARNDTTHKEAASTVVDSRCSSEKIKAMLHEWLRGEINFVSSDGPSNWTKRRYSIPENS